MSVAAPGALEAVGIGGSMRLSLSFEWLEDLWICLLKFFLFGLIYTNFISHKGFYV